MFPRGNLTLVTLVLSLAGCTTGPHTNRPHVPDWESSEFVAARENAPLLQPTAPPDVVAAPMAPTQADTAMDTWISLAEWCKDTGLFMPSRLVPAPVSTYSLTGPNGVLSLGVGSNLAHWQGLELWLGFAPQLVQGEPFVHWLDLRKTIQPLLTGLAPAPLASNAVIVIDPGHGGPDSGTCSVLANGYEKEFTLDWAQRLARALAASGFEARLTRNSDTELSLSNRVAFAQQHQANLFLSLHFNSAGASQDQAGLETYCLTPMGLPSSVTRGYSDDPALEFANNAFDAENLQLAIRVHQGLLRVNGHRDRGIRRARFPAVLRGQQCPAILVEGGYLSNPQEARQIADPAYRQKLAEAVAAALVSIDP